MGQIVLHDPDGSERRVPWPDPGDRVCYSPRIEGAAGGGPCQPAVITALGEGGDDIFADLSTPDGAPLVMHAMRYEAGPGRWGTDDFSSYCGGTWHVRCRADSGDESVSEQPPGDLPPVALEPDTLPEHPLRAQDCPALLPKEIG